MNIMAGIVYGLIVVTIGSAGLAVFMIYQKSREEARNNSRTDEDSAGND